MIEDPRNQISELHLPDSVEFQCWKVNFKTEVYANSPCPTVTMPWTKESEIATSMDDLMTSQSDFEVLDTKIASALKNIVSNPHFRRRINVEEQRAPDHDRFLRGRQIAYMICDHFRAIGFRHTDDIQEFDTRWYQALLPASDIPTENVLGGSYKLKNEILFSFRQCLMTMYDQELDQDRAMPSYQRLQTMVRRHIDQIRTRNFKARNERIETGYWSKVKKGKQSVLRGRWVLSVESNWTMCKKRLLQFQPRIESSTERTIDLSFESAGTD